MDKDDEQKTIKKLSKLLSNVEKHKKDIFKKKKEFIQFLRNEKETLVKEAEDLQNEKVAADKKKEKINEKIASTQESVEKLKKEVEESKEKVLDDTEKVSDLLGDVSKNAGLVEKNKEASDKHIEALKLQLKDSQKKLNEANHNVDLIKELYHFTTDQAIGNEFNKRSVEYKKHRVMWVLLLSVLAFAIVLLNHFLLTINNDDMLSLIFVRFLINTPFIGLALFITLNYSRADNLFVKYNHKAAVSLSLTMHSKFLQEELKVKEKDVGKFILDELKKIYSDASSKERNRRASISLNKGLFGFKLNLDENIVDDLLVILPDLVKARKSQVNQSTEING